MLDPAMCTTVPGAAELIPVWNRTVWSPQTPNHDDTTGHNWARWKKRKTVFTVGEKRAGDGGGGGEYVSSKATHYQTNRHPRNWQAKEGRTTTAKSRGLPHFGFFPRQCRNDRWCWTTGCQASVNVKDRTERGVSSPWINFQDKLMVPGG